MIKWVVLGLVPAGVGALVMSPLVVRRALRVFGQRGSRAREQRLAWLAAMLALGLGFVGALFTLLLALHVIG